jgi:hypothetical protein
MYKRLVGLVLGLAFVGGFLFTQELLKLLGLFTQLLELLSKLLGLLTQLLGELLKLMIPWAEISPEKTASIDKSKTE